MIQRKRKCKHCNAEFTTPKYAQIYCNYKCRQAAQRARRPKAKPTYQKRIDRLDDNSYFRWIIREVKRAGTVEVLTHVDLEELNKLYHDCYKSSGWGGSVKPNRYSLCHISPVKGRDTIGLLHHENLIIGRTDHNQKFSNTQYDGAGRHIERSKLQKRWLIKPSTPRKTVVNKIIKFLGQKLVEYTKQFPVNTATRLSTARRIHRTGESEYSLAQLESMNLSDLRSIEANIKGEEVYPIRKREPARTLLVYLDECERQSETNPSCRALVPFLRVACLVLAQAPYNWRPNGLEGLFPRRTKMYLPNIEIWSEGDMSKLRDWLAFLAFEVLSGRKLDASSTRDTFNRYAVVFETLDCSVDLSGETEEVANSVRQLREDLITTGLCVEVVCKSVTRHTRKPAITTPAATFNIHKNENKENNICHNQASRNDSKVTLRRKRFKDYWIAMDNHSQPGQTQLLMAS